MYLLAGIPISTEKAHNPIKREGSTQAQWSRGSFATSYRMSAQGIALHCLGFHLNRCLRTLRARLQSSSATSGGRARRARMALVRANLSLVFVISMVIDFVRCSMILIFIAALASVSSIVGMFWFISGVIGATGFCSSKW